MVLVLLNGQYYQIHYHNNPNNKQVVNNMTQHIGIGLGLGLGFGIGGFIGIYIIYIYIYIYKNVFMFIDRTRGVCDDKLDMYNLYTGDYIQSCSTLPFNGLYDTCSSIVREGYKSTLITTDESKDINNIKNKLLGDGNWITGPSMITPRASHGSVSWDEHIIFCCGGIGSTGRRISNVEMLRLYTSVFAHVIVYCSYT